MSNIIVFLILVLASAPGFQGEVTSLARKTENFNPETLSFELELQNQSGKPVTGFTLKLSTTFSDGTSSEAWFSMDFADSVPLEAAEGNVHVSGPLLPGQIYRYRTSAARKPSVATLDFTVEPVTVIFEDLTFEGESSWVENSLKGREARLLVYTRWLDKFEDALRTSLTPSELRHRIEAFRTSLELGTEVFGNLRVSSRHSSGQLAEQSLLQDLKWVLSSSDDPFVAFREVVSDLARSSKNLEEQVKHDATGRRIR